MRVIILVPMRTFFWDVDGVFVDTERLHFEAWRELFRRVGGTRALTVAEYSPCAGRQSYENMAMLCRLMGVPEQHETYNPIRRAIYASLRSHGIPTLPRNIALAKTIATQHDPHQFIAVSAAPRREIEENLTAASVRHLFKDIISFEDDPSIRRKPHPDLYLFALKKHGLAGKDVLAFEDSASGVMAATTAEIRCIALANDFTKEQDFEKAVIVAYPEESAEMIAKKMGLTT